MAVVNKIRSLLRQKKGDEAVSFLLTTAMLVLIFVTLISAMIYIMQYYDASYLCRRVVRSIEITGVYDETETRDIIDRMKNSDLEDIDVQVDAAYFSGKKIQLRQTFSVTLTASYKITILELGENPIVMNLPIRVKVAGMSEVYWKS
ncbi:DUF4320 family protein [Caproiciproducens galactitolivorans]|jgi:hypothetical protein|uniref:DUF4320 family protein n=1 Tax=Caproiciproducens galactitolivorans TaxID=642589 RepID=UPI00240948F7|nr:DUF4320 family protein [Caproiciproducens galactitolivorans]